MKIVSLLFLVVFRRSFCYKDYNISLLIARGDDICLRVTYNKLVTVVKAKDARILDVHFPSNLIYWYDSMDKKIYKTTFGKGEKIAVLENEPNVGGLAIDWTYSHIFFTNTNKKTIEVTNLDGNKRSVLFTAQIYTPRTIAIDPKMGWIFFSAAYDRQGYPGLIGKSSMDGTLEAIARGTFITLNALTDVLTVDVVEKRFHYIDISRQLLLSTDYNFANEVILFNKPHAWKIPNAITTFRNYIYWSDKKGKVILRANLKTGLEIHEVTKKLNEVPYGMQMGDAYKQPINENFCETEPMYCPHMCLPKASGFDPIDGYVTCTCPEGFHLGPNKITCTNDTNVQNTKAYLLFVHFRGILKISIDTYEMKALDTSVLVHSVDFHFSTGTIFWTGADGVSIFKAKIDNTAESTLMIDTGKLGAKVVAVDWVYNNIYWTSLLGTVSVANFTSRFFKVLLDDGYGSKTWLAVNPLEGWMFWSNGATSTIWKAGMDGSRKTEIVRLNILKPRGISIDYDEKRIYWADGSLDSISSCDYDGINQIEILKVIAAPFCVATFKGFVYWTNRGKVPLLKANVANATIQPVSRYMGVSEEWMTGGALKVYHESKQPIGKNYCEISKMKCSHFCLPGPANAAGDPPKTSCFCPEHFRMLRDGFTCKEDVYSERCNRRYVVEVRIYTNSTYYIQCSGTIISERWIITSASCVSKTTFKRNIKIRGTPGSNKEWDVMRSIIYPDFLSNNSTANDLALLKAAQRVPEQRMIHPIKTDKFAEADILTKNSQIAVSRNYCENRYLLPSTLLSICGTERPLNAAETDMCQGGPLIDNGAQIGILSKVIDIDKYVFTLFTQELHRDFIVNYTGIKHRRIIYNRPSKNLGVSATRV